MKSILLALVSIAALAAGIALLFHRGPDAPTDAKVYVSAAYGYSLSYPASLDVKEYLPEDVVFGRVTDDAVDGVVEARVMTIEGQPGEPFADALAEQLENLCAADGPTGSFSCVGVKESDPFESEAGAAGTRITLIGQFQDFKAGTATEVDKGPYYAFPLASGATGSSVLVVHAPLNQSLAEADAAGIDAIARSVALPR